MPDNKNVCHQTLAAKLRNRIFNLIYIRYRLSNFGASSVGLICSVYHPRKTVPISTTLNSHKIFRPFLFCFPFLYAFIIAPLQKFVNTFFHFLNVFVEILFRCVLKKCFFSFVDYSISRVFISVNTFFIFFNIFI